MFDTPIQCIRSSGQVFLLLLLRRRQSLSAVVSPVNTPTYLLPDLLLLISDSDSGFVGYIGQARCLQDGLLASPETLHQLQPKWSVCLPGRLQLTIHQQCHCWLFVSETNRTKTQTQPINTRQSLNVQVGNSMLASLFLSQLWLLTFAANISKLIYYLPPAYRYHQCEILQCCLKDSSVMSLMMLLYELRL